MSARRYYLGTLPFEHINGKIAPVAVRCANTYDPDAEPKVSFFYGYRHKATPKVSRYGIRSVRRDLNAKPYTAAEDENRTIFTASLQSVHTHKKIAADWALMLADFDKQSNYATPIGYAVASCRANGGEWLPEWVA